MADIVSRAVQRLLLAKRSFMTVQTLKLMLVITEDLNITVILSRKKNQDLHRLLTELQYLMMLMERKKKFSSSH